MKQLDLFGGGVLNRTTRKASGRGILTRHEARVYLQYMLRMLKESRKCDTDLK